MPTWAEIQELRRLQAVQAARYAELMSQLSPLVAGSPEWRRLMDERQAALTEQLRLKALESSQKRELLVAEGRLPLVPYVSDFTEAPVGAIRAAVEEQLGAPIESVYMMTDQDRALLAEADRLARLLPHPAVPPTYVSRLSQRKQARAGEPAALSALRATVAEVNALLAPSPPQPGPVPIEPPIVGPGDPTSWIPTPTFEGTGPIPTLPIIGPGDPTSWIPTPTFQGTGPMRAYRMAVNGSRSPIMDGVPVQDAQFSLFGDIVRGLGTAVSFIPGVGTAAGAIAQGVGSIIDVIGGDGRSRSPAMPAGTPGIAANGRGGSGLTPERMGELLGALGGTASGIPGGGYVGGQVGGAIGSMFGPGGNGVAVNGAVSGDLLKMLPLTAAPGTQVRAKAPRGYRIVTLPDGKKIAARRDIARQLGWRPKRKAPISAGDWRQLQTASKVERKAKRIAQKAGFQVRTKAQAARVKCRPKK